MGGAGLAGGQGDAHAAPVFARALRHLRQARQLQFLGGAVQRGAIRRLPAGAAHLIRQAHRPALRRRQRHLHHADLGARAAGALALGQQRRQLALDLLLLARQLVLARQAVLPGLAQRGGGGGDLRGRRGAGGVPVGAEALEVAGGEVDAGRLGLERGHLVLQRADALIERAGAGLAQQRARLLAHADLADAHRAVARGLQAGRVQAGGQAGKHGLVGAGGHAQLAHHGGRAGVERDGADARAAIGHGGCGGRRLRAGGAGQHHGRQAGHERETAIHGKHLDGVLRIVAAEARAAPHGGGAGVTPCRPRPATAPPGRRRWHWRAAPPGAGRAAAQSARTRGAAPAS